MATTPRLSSRDPKETEAIEQTARLRTVNPDEQLVEAAKDESELVVEVESDSPVQEEVKESRPTVEAHVEVPRVEPKVDVTPDEGVETLKKQIEELKAFRTAENQRLQAALQEAQQKAKEAEQYKQFAYNSQYDSVVNTLSAAQLEVEAASQQYAMAMQAQDFMAASEANKRIAKAEATIAKLEDGKRAIEEERTKPQPRQEQTGNQLLPQEQAWLDMHPEVMKNQVLNERLNAAYYQAYNRGLARGTQAYFDYIEQELGYRARPEPTGRGGDARPVQDNIDPALVSAPVSRETQTMSGEPTRRTTFRLTKEQAEIAKSSGLTPQEYAKQLIKLEEMKKADPERYYGRS